MREKHAAMQLDDFDWRILDALQRNARMTNVELAEVVHLSPSQCARRLRALEEAGVVQAYRAQLDPQAIGLTVLAFTTVTLEKHAAHQAEIFHEAVRAIPEILECHQVTGEGDYLLRVVAEDLASFSRLLTQQLMRLPGVASLRSSIGLTAIKAGSPLPIAHSAPPPSPSPAPPPLPSGRARLRGR